MKFGSIEIDPIELGINGNAILGIKESGKSYLGTELGEVMFDAGIPFVAFDPIGIWHNMKVPGRGKGYPIVVAGGVAADIPLRVETAPAIVEAAMHKRVSLVLDLFDIGLSKADWHKIVRDCSNLLLHRNAQHGLRHIFIEEAAEFVPQRPMDGLTYAAVEKLIRMGGNARLGCTLITPRSQEVNKAVLELCENIFLFRQRGKLALENLKKWLDVAGAAATDVMRTLPNLPTGECWAWLGGSDLPVHLKVPAKNSFHPDRRALQGEVATRAKPVSASKFVSALQEELPKLEEEAKANDPKALKAEIVELKRKLAAPERTDAPPAWPDLRQETAGLRDRLRVAVAALRQSRDDLAELLNDAGCLQTDVQAAYKQLHGTIVNLVDPGGVDSPGPEETRPVRRSDPPLVSRSAPLLLSQAERALAANRGLPDGQPDSAGADAGLTKSRHAILDKIGWATTFFNEPSVERQVLAFLLGKHPRTKSVLNDLGGLKTGGYIEYLAGNRVGLTPLGEQMAADPGQPSGAELLAGVKSVLSPRQAQILDQVLMTGTAARESLAAYFGLHVRTKSFLNDLGRMKSLGLIYYGPEQTIGAAAFIRQAAASA